MRCMICEKEIYAVVCPYCGNDLSCCAECYPTLDRIPMECLSIRTKRNAWIAAFSARQKVEEKANNGQIPTPSASSETNQTKPSPKLPQEEQPAEGRGVPSAAPCEQLGSEPTDQGESAADSQRNKADSGQNKPRNQSNEPMHVNVKPWWLGISALVLLLMGGWYLNSKTSWISLLLYGDERSWSEWAEDLPKHVDDENYEIESRQMYRSRHLGTTSSTTDDRMEGWELSDSIESVEGYGAWSDWSEEEVLSSETRDVESETRYRYREKETKTGSSDSMPGWTLEEISYDWGDYGSWSEWSTEKVTASESREVQEETRWRYRDKETTTSTNSSLPGWNLYDSSSAWGDWSDWGAWQTTPINATESTDIDTRTQSRCRDISYSTEYTAWSSWSGWQNTSISENDCREVETRYIQPTYQTEYNYSRYNESDPAVTGRRIWDGPTKGWWGGHYCQYYQERGWSTDKLEYQWSDSGYSVYGWSGNYWYNEKTRQTEAAPGYTQYRCRTRSSYSVENHGSWSSWSNTIYSESSTREVEYRTQYRCRTRSMVNTYYFYRWNDWCSWSTTAVSKSNDRQVEHTSYFRFRDRTSIPVYHFYRWKDWSSWTVKQLTESDTKLVEEKKFYRYRDLIYRTTYYFQRWTDWSDYGQTPIESNDDVEVQVMTEYRYKRKDE